jgi:predicted NBD/HSP70 family sugar kinase
MMQKATRQHTKQHNSRLVLKTIYDHAEISRAEIARLTHLTRTTVSELVSDLIADGLVEETGTGISIGGKPPILLSVNPVARQLVTLDLSGDHFEGALVDLQGRLLKRIVLPDDLLEGEQALNAVCDLVDSLVTAASAPVAGIGVGSPGLIDTGLGVVRRAVNLNWVDMPLQQHLAARFDLPVVVANDSHLSAMAEYMFGEGRGISNLIVIKVSQGIGSGIVLDGQLYYGDGFGAGEIGHIRAAENNIRCTCGNTGCLETVASTRAILRQISGKLPTNGLYSLGQVVEAYHSGAIAVQEVVHQAAACLGATIAYMAGILNIHNIILTGPVRAFGESFLDVVRAEVASRLLLNLAEEIDIRFSSLGDDDVLLGASALILSQEFGLP